MSTTRWPGEFARYLRTETVGGLVLLGAAAIALLWANSPWADAYLALRDHRLGPPALHLDLTLGTWAKDGLLALFFFVAGLEVKRELVVGELADRRAATLPVAAALGGMVVPALLALAIGRHGQAWAIPVATDIAFALAVLAVTGGRLPAGARVFLLSLAVVDDLGAIALIAVLFTDSLDALALSAAAALCVLYAWLQRRRVRSPLLYVPIALATWYAVHESGVHATVAGVALALCTRVRADAGEPEAPALRLEHRLQPWSAGVAVPVFALFASGVPIGAAQLRALTGDRVAIAVVVGLVLGKLIGIVGAAWLSVRLRVAVLPTGLGWRDLTAVAMLGGVGFTVSLLIAELALTGPGVERAKAAVLLASALASVLGAALLVRRGRARRGTMAAVTSTQSTGNGRHLPPQVPSIPLSPDLPVPAQDQSIGTLVRDASAHLSTLLRSEVELAKSEVVSEVRKGLKGSVYFIVALTIGLFSLFFLFLALGEVLDIWLPRSAAFGIVFGLMLVGAALCALLGYRRLKSIQKPERTINSLQEAVHLTRRDGDGAAHRDD